MNQNNSIMMNNKTSEFVSKFLTDEDYAKIHKEIPPTDIPERMRRVVKVGQENMRKQLMPYYENLSRDIDLVNGVDPDRERFLQQVQKSMKNFLDDTLNDGSDQEAYYILCYFLEVKGKIGGVVRTDVDETVQLGTLDVKNDITFNRFKHLISSHDQKKAIEAILYEYL